jgi:hypothetical protein
MINMRDDREVADILHQVPGAGQTPEYTGQR